MAITNPFQAKEEATSCVSIYRCGSLRGLRRQGNRRKALVIMKEAATMGVRPMQIRSSSRAYA